MISALALDEVVRLFDGSGPPARRYRQINVCMYAFEAGREHEHDSISALPCA